MYREDTPASLLSDFRAANAVMDAANADLRQYTESGLQDSGRLLTLISKVVESQRRVAALFNELQSYRVR